MARKVRIFVSHSFDQSDSADVERILALMKLPRFHLDVLTARSPEATAIGDKIERFVDWADVTFGLFTVRHRDPDHHICLPSPFVISECSFAKGRYRDDDRKGVHGLVEEGVQHSDLGLATVRGEEFPVFTRAALRSGQTKPIEDFLLTLQRRYGPEVRGALKRPYKQRSLQKTVEIYRNGTICSKNTVDLLVFDPAAVEGQPIEHELWLPPGLASLPTLAEMGRTPTKDRSHAPCFACRVFGRGSSSIDEAVAVDVLSEHKHSIKFRLRFPFALKPQDSIRYQYIWSVCQAAAPFEDDLSDGQYNQVSLRTPHGQIDNVQLTLKFERETLHGASAEIFSKQPILLQTYTPREEGLPTSDSVPVKKIDVTATWETYQVEFERFQGSAIVRWRPSSLHTVQQTLEPAGFQALDGQRTLRAAPVLAQDRRQIADG